MTKIWAFLTGKKTYLAALALALLAAGGFWYGQVDAVGAGTLLAIAGGIAGLGHKTDRYSRLLITELQSLKQNKKLDEKALLDAAVEEGIDRVSSAATYPGIQPSKPWPDPFDKTGGSSNK